ncbi:hypothetical protein DSM104443_01899 [Usitatibacter rugosus]|uniref:Threonine/serine exporter-like N-terminal domain-containing protein n=1 Tax=Usitatibacter rugosus TaxID=2732067 RepID=A0A6M4GU08_9PROT|nr:threonine/serine exporter family protein [Usitatibacter rugosus]QJR10829.1 hypothetical protein DSM104443_01899 [Usitatibacter rugosus]
MHDASPTTEALSHRRVPQQLLRFLSRLGHVLLSTGDAVSVIEEVLRRIALAQGAQRVNIIAFPTVLFVKFEDGDLTCLDFTGDEGLTLRFDQTEAVFALARDAENPEMDLGEALRRLEAILAAPPLYHPVTSLLGHVLVTVGIALVLHPSIGVIGLAAGFGFAVGALRLFARSRGGILQTLLPTFSAFMVSAIALEMAKHGYGESPVRVLIAALVTFLPGGILAVATMDLAYGDVVSGSSRFVTGVLQLVFLVLGMMIAASFVGLPASKILVELPDATLLTWGPWLGVAFFGIGHVLYYSSPLRNLPWILAVLFVVYAGQRLGNAAFGGYMSGFVGAIIATPVSYFIQYRVGGPPAVVTFLPALWLLLPSSLALLGLAEVVTDNPLSGVQDFIATVFAIVAIALGSLIGSGIYNQYVDPIFKQTASLAASVSKFRWRRRG